MMKNLISGEININNTNKEVLEIEFSHEKANCLSSSMLETLHYRIEEVFRMDDVRAIVLSSSGDGAFCSGAYIDELKSYSTLEETKKFFSAFAKVIISLKSCTVPVIAKIQGPLVGGGMGIAAACDYLIATDRSKVRLSELEVGLAPLVIGPVVSLKLGRGNYSALAWDTQWRDATWCLDKGLFSKVVSSDKLGVETSLFIDSILSYELNSTKQLKSANWRGTEDWGTLLHERAKNSALLWMNHCSKE